MIDGKGFKLSQEVEPLFNELVFAAHRQAGRHSGNARMVRNLLEKILRHQSARIADLDAESEELNVIRPEDILPEQGTKKKAYDLDEALAGVIGLEEVKSFIRSLYARLRLEKERKKMNLPAHIGQTLHMIFKGNPGTGKTMMARTVADVLYNIGIISTSKLVETDRSGLVAGYVGQTALKTQEKVMEAQGGVLFIDEAYALAQGGPQDFGREAIDTLVKLMDDNRERLVVILAGYSADMDRFLETNPGLRSRFAHIVEFWDYELNDLMRIANGLYASRGYELTAEAGKKLRTLFDKARQEPSFGNGRYVRNMFEHSLNAQALRLSSIANLSREQMVTIEVDDLEKI
jgi:SpoVK/Ycf46/Vps4 family AAA+-type ATPase